MGACTPSPSPCDRRLSNDAVAGNVGVADDLALARPVEQRKPRHQPHRSRNDQDQADGRKVDAGYTVLNRIAKNRADSGQEDGGSDSHNDCMPRFWLYMQVVIMICVIASMVIAVIKL